jgi:hypothetical protein
MSKFVLNTYVVGILLHFMDFPTPSGRKRRQNGGRLPLERWRLLIGYVFYGKLG